MKSYKFNKEIFNKFGQSEKLKCLQSIYLISKFNILNQEEICKILNCIDINIFKDTGEENYCLLYYAKIPGEYQKEKGIKALEAIFNSIINDVKYKSLKDIFNNEGLMNKIAGNEIGKEALITFAKIPGNDELRLKALESLLNVNKENKKILSDILIIAKNIRNHLKCDKENLRSKCDELINNCNGSGEKYNSSRRCNFYK